MNRLAEEKGVCHFNISSFTQELDVEKKVGLCLSFFEILHFIHYQRFGIYSETSIHSKSDGEICA